MKAITPERIWSLYQKFDYMGEDFRYKFLIFKDNGVGEMAIYNADSREQIESVSMSIISKKDFLDLVKRIIKKKPRDVSEWLKD